MLIAGFPAGPWGTNCYVVATGPGAECVVVDPGKDAAAGVAEVVREHQLKPVSVLVTHGHIDHMWCVAPVAGTYDAAAYIHPADRHLLSDPMSGTVAGDRRDAARREATSSPSPTGVEELTDLQRIELAGLEFVVDHTPGHTPGSVTFRTPYAEATRRRPSEILFSGDLLFAGSIGRTDLPGGDHPTMLRSLTDKVLPLADDIAVLPGHGEQTSIGRERATNPFLLELLRAADAPDARPAPRPVSTMNDKIAGPEGRARVPPARLRDLPRRPRGAGRAGRQRRLRLRRAARLRGHQPVRPRAWGSPPTW